MRSPGLDNKTTGLPVGFWHCQPTWAQLLDVYTQLQKFEFGRIPHAASPALTRAPHYDRSPSSTRTRVSHIHIRRERAMARHRSQHKHKAHRHKLDYYA